MTRHPFGFIPDDLRDDRTIPPAAKLLWSRLDSLARTASHVLIAGPTLCALADVAPSSLCRHRAALVAGGWLEHVPAAGGRGAIGTWTVLRRGRAGIRGGSVAVDKWGRRRVTTLSESGQCEQGYPPSSERVGTGPYKERARTEEEAPAARVVDLRGVGGRPAWCGRCAPDTRLLEVQDGVVVHGPSGRRYPEGSLAPCPSCHPAAVPAF